MKFLEHASLRRINDFLSDINLGERTIKGCVEAYSCKHAGSDKKQSFSLENEIIDYLGKSSDADSSPTEYLLSSASRKTLIYLLLTVSHMYPDYDFSAAKEHDLFIEESLDTFSEMIDTYMSDASKKWMEENDCGSLHEALFKALYEVVDLPTCEVYTYNPDSDSEPLIERGAIWSFCFFFYNRKLKRIVVFRICCFSNLVPEAMPICDSSVEEDDIFANMDLRNLHLPLSVWSSACSLACFLPQ